jgi:hypothetical protein
MDLLKAKIYLDKLNREFARMLKDPDNIPRIDVDITQSYIRELYDAFLSDVPDAKSVAAPRKVVEAPPPVVVAPPPPPVVVAPPPPPPVVVAPPPPPVVVAPPPPPVVVAPPPPPVVVAPPPPPPPVVVTPPPPPPVVGAPPPPIVVPPAPVEPPPTNPVTASVSAGDAEILFEYREAKELSEKLSDTAISDLKRAISLNDRLMIQRELFGNDNPLFEAALTTLNNASGFEAAKVYLLNECIGRFDWLHKNKVETAKSFIRLVRRRYK